MAGSAEIPAGLCLDRLAEIEELLRLQGGPDSHRPVQEVGLVRDLPHRLRLIERRDGIYFDTSGPKRVDGAADLRLAVADVRAETQKPDPLDPHLTGRAVARPRIYSSSSGSRSSERSSVTSTPAS